MHTISKFQAFFLAFGAFYAAKLVQSILTNYLGVSL